MCGNSLLELSYKIKMKILVPLNNAELLQKYIFIPLDIFKENQQNKDIKSKLDAWLVFLSMDNPEMIVKLIETYPEFKPMYEQIYDICRNIEEVMEMFSKELRELDRNTVLYMIDEMQDELDQKKIQLQDTESKLNDAHTQLNSTQDKLHSTQDALHSAQDELQSTQDELQKALLKIAELEHQHT